MLCDDSKLRSSTSTRADTQSDLLAFCLKPARGHLPSLANLDLSGNSFGKKALRWDSCNWPHLTKLTVSQCSLGVSDIEGLVRGHWPLLACLDVGDNNLYHSYLRSLAQGLWPELLELRLANNGNSALEELHQASWKSLRMLDLGAHILHSALHWKQFMLHCESLENRYTPCTSVVRCVR